MCDTAAILLTCYVRGQDYSYGLPTLHGCIHAPSYSCYVCGQDMQTDIHFDTDALNIETAALQYPLPRALHAAGGRDQGADSMFVLQASCPIFSNSSTSKMPTWAGTQIKELTQLSCHVGNKQLKMSLFGDPPGSLVYTPK